MHSNYVIEVFTVLLIDGPDPTRATHGVSYVEFNHSSMHSYGSQRPGLHNIAQYIVSSIV
jgi:hypothetical protein